jgi:tRNA/tmRNA/rRNA uracil-C5-methylase (TrmA/RlmC/RlmD family)
VSEITIGPVAHGGHCVARPDDGPVLFVRHALPGEKVRVEITEKKSGFWRADAVEILEPSPDRTAPPCPYARPGACGGCDFQHAVPPAQRELKAAVVREQLQRLAGVDLPVAVGELPGGQLGWRSRVQFTVADDGGLGFHRHRSSSVIPVAECPIAHPAINALDLPARKWDGVGAVEAIATTGGDVAVLTRPAQSPGPRRGPAHRHHAPLQLVDGPEVLRETVDGREWRIDPAGFWQVHPAAPSTLVATVLELLDPQPRETAWDLYAGAGLFAAALAPRVHRVAAVESDRRSVAAARRALGDLPNVRVVDADVRRALADPRWRSVDLVVLDPPRSGAGREVTSAIAERGPRAVAYVACDPAAFARDVATFAAHGYRLESVRGFDAFPMTHHVECVGLLVR